MPPTRRSRVIGRGAWSRVPVERLKESIDGLGRPRNFFDAVTRKGSKPLNLIAEVKKASPSAGVIRPDFDAVDIAMQYEAAGAVPDPESADSEELKIILQTLQRTNWNKQEAAQILGLYRPTLYSKMKKHDIRDGGKAARAAVASAAPAPTPRRPRSGSASRRAATGRGRTSSPRRRRRRRPRPC